MQLNLRNRISFFYLISTAILTGIIFIAIYFSVSETVYRHMDEDLDAESNEIEKNLVVLNDQFIIANAFEWNEREHGQIEVNPVFIQIIDASGKIIKKTGNLLNGKLNFDSQLKTEYYFNTSLSGSQIRQVQIPIKNPSGVILGYIIVAMPLSESSTVLNNLFVILLGTFWLVLLALYYITRYIAGKSISPINKVISTAERITKENLDERIELPEHKDEIYKLTSTINDLLNRLEDAVLREKQFTSDASHELRTPLAVLKGTLEVLIRKPRDVNEYESKIKYCISEVDRMTLLIEQLLMLARFESGKVIPVINEIDLNTAMQAVIQRVKSFADEKKLSIKYDDDVKVSVHADSSMVGTIFENILTNAIKYSNENGCVNIKIESIDGKATCYIQDNGLGMTEEQASRIFDRFYRGDESRNSRTEGNGIGLAIVKKLADLQNISISVSSQVEKGTVFIVSFIN